MASAIPVYQTKHITPYIHAMVAHLPKFMQLYGRIVPFTQQGVEKLNDIYTQYYFRSTNHRELESLEQLLLYHELALAIKSRLVEIRTSMCTVFLMNQNLSLSPLSLQLCTAFQIKLCFNNGQHKYNYVYIL